MDLAKDKYGGPFTTEQVEDVKAFLGILQVLLTLGPMFATDTAANDMLYKFSNHLQNNWYSEHASTPDASQYLLSIFIIDTTGHVQHSNSQCFLQQETENNLDLSVRYLMLPYILNALNAILSIHCHI